MDDTWNDSEAKGLLDNETHSTPNRHPQRHLYAVANVLVLLFTNFLTGLVVSERWLEGCSRPSHRSAGLANRLLYKDLDRKSLHPVNFSAFSLQPSRYTAPASAEVDQEWRALGVEYFAFLVPLGQAPAFCISDEHVVVPGDAPGAKGQPGYVADMDGLHQLHCLNLLRKSLFFNYPYYSSHSQAGVRHGEFREFSDSPQEVQGHINHCVDALRERIMCAADSEVLPYYWRDMQGFTTPDFAVTRQCRNFESLRSWAQEHQLEDWGWSYRLTTPKDAFLFPNVSEI